jgi:hypothetical protein
MTALIVVQLVVSSVFADDPGLDDGPKEAPATFETIVSRIAGIEASGEWRKQEWTDRIIRDWLLRITHRVREKTKRDFVTLPVDFKDVDVEAKANDHTLHVGKDINLAHATHSIILATDSVRIGHAKDSVIIANGSVNIDHSNRNVIVAGGAVDLGHDGNDAFRDGADPNPRRNAVPLKHGSTILGGKEVTIAHAQGTICSAPLGLTIGHARQVIYLNTPQRKVSWEHEACRDIGDDGMPRIATDTRRMNQPNAN